MNIVEKRLSKLIGVPCWGVDWGRYTNLILNFGEPYLWILEPKNKVKRNSADKRIIKSRGILQLRLGCAFWKLSLNNFLPITGTSSWRQIRMGLARLEGQKLVLVSVNAYNGFSKFTFDFGAILEVRRFGPNEKDEMWALLSKKGTALFVRGDGYYFIGKAENKGEWKALPKLVEIGAQ